MSILICIAAPLCVEDLENLLHESLLFSFNTEIEDGSIEEVMYYIPFEPNCALHVRFLRWPLVV